MIYFILLIIGFILLYLLGIKNKRLRDYILNNGIETIGTVVNRTKGIEDGDIYTFGVHFDFYVNGKLIKSHQGLTGEKEYNNAIVGMKYKVKYLPDKPNINSIILINEPQKMEYKNIPIERERIMRTYKNAKWFLDKNAQPLEEKRHLKKTE